MRSRSKSHLSHTGGLHFIVEPMRRNQKSNADDFTEDGAGTQGMIDPQAEKA